MPDFNAKSTLSVSPMKIGKVTPIDKAPNLASEQRSMQRKEFNMRIQEINQKKCAELEDFNMKMK